MTTVKVIEVNNLGERAETSPTPLKKIKAKDLGLTKDAVEALIKKTQQEWLVLAKAGGDAK